MKRSYTKEFNRKFAVQAAEPGESAFVPCQRTDLERVFSIQTERTVNRDNTVRYNNLTMQIDKQSWRRSMEGCRVTIYQHLDGTITIGFGPQQLGKYSRNGQPAAPKSKAVKTADVEMPLPRKTVKDTVSLSSLEKSRQNTSRLSHIPTTATATNF